MSDPDYFYSVMHDVHRGTSSDLVVQTLMIDTTILVGDFEPNDKRPAVTAEEQWAWIEDELKRSTADFLFVSGHYPVFSGCEHGSTDILLAKLKPMLEAYNVTAYISGHDHCAEHFVEAPDRPAYIVSGAGRECCYKASQADKLPANITKFAYWQGACPAGAVCPQPGATAFAAVHINKTEATALYFDAGLRLLYRSAPMLSRRHRLSHKTTDEEQDLKSREGPELGGFETGNQFATCTLLHSSALSNPSALSAVQCVIPWRRRPMVGQCVRTKPNQCENPLPTDTVVKNDVVVVAQDNTTVTNRVLVNRSFVEGAVVFEPIPGASVYTVYYAPFVRPADWHDVLTPVYAQLNTTAEAEWARRNGVDAGSIASGRWKTLPRAVCGGVDAITAYDRRTELEMSASPDQVAAMVRQSGSDLLLFAEERTRPIRMLDSVPVSWAQNGPSASFEAAAEPDEFRMFQVGAFAPSRRLESVSVRLPQPNYLVSSLPLTKDLLCNARCRSVCRPRAATLGLRRASTRRVSPPTPKTDRSRWPSTRAPSCLCGSALRCLTTWRRARQLPAR